MILFQLAPPHYQMSNYTEGEMLLTIKVKDTFVVDIEQHSVVTELVTGVKTSNSTLVTRLKLRFQPFKGDENFKWEDEMRIVEKKIYSTGE
jgi:hypothetical protein